MPPNNQPYIYAPPQRYSAIDPYNGFDPKAVTRASLVPSAPPKPRPQQQGPLLEFNRHPDSYLIVPYGQTDAKPMHPGTKKAVKVTRWAQLGFRVSQMIGALGMLVCVICIHNTDATDAYIIRVPVAIDILTTGYSIYHLARNARSRPPASSASYHFFALIIDAGLIPFYVFIAMLAKAELPKSAHNDLRWKTFFDGKGTDKILLSTWLDGAVLAATHLATCSVSLFLALVFRKIAQLPPDFNPLEDNLTSRRKSKHKYKNSEISKSDISGPMTESSVTLANSGRSSPAKESTKAEVRPLSFLHTRTNSDYSYSPHNPNTANMSRSTLPVPRVPSIYSQPRSERLSRPNLSQQDVHIQGTDDHERTQTLQSTKSMMTSSSVYSDTSDKQDIITSRTPPLPRKSSQRHSLLSDNWFVHKNDQREGREIEHENVSPAISIVDEYEDEDIVVHSGDQRSAVFNFGMKKSEERPYQLVRQDSSPNGYGMASHRLVPVPPPKDDGFRLAPLGMNPPTPPPGFIPQRGPVGKPSSPLTATSGNVPVVQSANSSSPKSRYYGDLGSAVSGIRSSPKSSPRATPSPYGHSTNRQSKYDSGVSGVSGQPSLYSQGPNARNRDDGRYDRIGQQDFATGRRQNRGMVDANGRVVSRSGADIADEPLYDYNAGRSSMKTGMGNIRGRNVSGKDAEEGRGGMWTARS